MRHILVWLGLWALSPSTHAVPSFDCSSVASHSIEQQICTHEELAALDRRMAEVYRAAVAKAADEHPPVLKAEQRGWIKGRNDCWKSAEPIACITANYQLRIAELQARYRLLPANGPYFFACDGEPSKEVVVTYFSTEPPTASVEFGDSTSLMYLQLSASGARYQGQNESFWEHHGEARVVWGYQAPEMVCQLQTRD